MTISSPIHTLFLRVLENQTISDWLHQKIPLYLYAILEGIRYHFDNVKQLWFHVPHPFAKAKNFSKNPKLREMW